MFGVPMVAELVQNSDDAGATRMALCLDARTHSSSSLAWPAAATFQGPALLAYNSAEFSAEDFASIQRIGDSLKRESSKGTKTGRFGVG